MTAPSSGAARHSLTRIVDADYGEDWARELARPAAATGALDAAAMVFRVGAEWLAVPLAMVSAVAPDAPVQRLPHRANGALLGIAAAGGRLLPAVSLARLLDVKGAAAGDAPAGRHAFKRLLVLAESGTQAGSQSGAFAFALPVDEVHGVLRYAGAALLPPAATVGRAPPPLVAGVLNGAVGESAAALLDARLLAMSLRGLLR